MQREKNTVLQILRLLVPSDCPGCQFNSIHVVEMGDGTRKRMFHCKRRDCDNWQTEEVEENPRKIVETG